MKLTAPQLQMLRDVCAGRDPFGRSTAANQMFERLKDQGLLTPNPLGLTDEGRAALRLAGASE